MIVASGTSSAPCAPSTAGSSSEEAGRGSPTWLRLPGCAASPKADHVGIVGQVLCVGWLETTRDHDVDVGFDRAQPRQHLCAREVRHREIE